MDATRFSPNDIDFSPLTECDYKAIPFFSCGEEKLDKFFLTEMSLCAKYHYLSPYKCTQIQTGEIVALFTLANDVVLLEYEDIIDLLNYKHEYSGIFPRQTSYPAVNIGHLAVRNDLQSKGIGSMIVNFIAATFSNQRVSGCQFITVDALNNQRTLDFYQLKLGFEFLTFSDVGKESRRMYLDIFTQL